MNSVKRLLDNPLLWVAVFQICWPETSQTWGCSLRVNSSFLTTRGRYLMLLLQPVLWLMALELRAHPWAYSGLVYSSSMTSWWIAKENTARMMKFSASSRYHVYGMSLDWSDNMMLSILFCLYVFPKPSLSGVQIVSFNSKSIGILIYHIINIGPRASLTQWQLQKKKKNCARFLLAVLTHAAVYIFSLSLNTYLSAPTLQSVFQELGYSTG